MLKKLIHTNLDDLILCCGGVGGTFLLIQIIIGCVMYFAKPDSSLLLSGAVLPCIAGFMALIVSISHLGLSFDQALQCGQTRRRALGLTLGLAGFEALCSMGLAALLTLLERILAPGFWLWLSGRESVVIDAIPPIPEPGLTASEAALRAQYLFIEDFALDWWWLPLIVLGGMAAGIIVAAVIQRFGGRGGWFLWTIWMVVCFAPQLLPRTLYIPMGWFLPLLGISAMAALIWSIWSLLHAVVKA